MLPGVTAGQKRHFTVFGFVQMRGVLHAEMLTALSIDYDRVIGSRDLRRPFNELGQPPAFTAFCMSDASPCVLDLATNDATLEFAAAFLGVPAICVQASAYQRSGDTRWHTDNVDLDYQGLKLYLNLDPVDEKGGALRVLPGSQHDALRRALVPPPSMLVEKQFGLASDQLPAAILTSDPGDVNVFDLRAWHAVCGTMSRRRVIELTYYAVPETASAREGFVTQMTANLRQARLSSGPYFTRSWRQAGASSHQHGLQILGDLGVLDVGRI
jgi:hypothetical protein